MRATVAAAIAIVAIVGCGAAAPRLSSAALEREEEPTPPSDREGEPGADDREGDDVRDDGFDSHDSARGTGQRADRFDHGDGQRGTDDDLDRFGADDPREPSARPRIAEVLTAAYVAAGLAGRLPGHIAVRARLGGLVPWVSVRTGRDASWHDEDPDVGRGTTLEVRATWRIDRLVFDGRELQVVALEAARRRERRRLATLVIRTYFAWKRSGSRSRAEEAAAELDALTSGWFSEARRRAASEVRTVAPSAPTP